MGAKESKSNNSNNNSSSIHVYLNVYHAKQSHFHLPGFGVYHSGVEIFDTEYTFADNGTKLSGITTHRPKTQPGNDNPWEYEKTVDLGTTPCTREELRLIINELNSEWGGNLYDLTSRNCNHFSEALCKRLGVSFPSWVNRAAKFSNPIRKALGGSGNNNNGTTVVAVGEDDIRPVTEADKAALIHENVENMELLTSGLIQISKSTCLNEHKTNNLASIFNPKNRLQQKYYLQSDADEQLLIYICFDRNIKLVGFQMQLSLKHSPNHPKTIKFFANQLDLNFDDCNNDTVKPTATFDLPPLNQIEEDARGSLTKITKNPQSKQEKKNDLVSIHIPVKTVHFQHVNGLWIFVENNQTGADTTIIHGFDFFGRPAEKK